MGVGLRSEPNGDPRLFFFGQGGNEALHSSKADLSIQIPRLMLAEGHLTRTRFAAMLRNIALLPLPAN